MQSELFQSRVRAILAALALVASVGASNTALASSLCGALPAREMAQERQAHLKVLNRLRRRHSLGALENSPSLDGVAQAYACKLAETGHFDHVGPDGSTLEQRVRTVSIPFCRFSENLAKGQPTLREAMLGWIQSEGHYRTLIDRNLTEVGFGMAYPTAGGAGVQSVPSNALGSLAAELRGVKAPPRTGPEGPRVWVQVFGTPCSH